MGTEGTGKLLVGTAAFAALMAGDLDAEGDRLALARLAGDALAGGPHPVLADFACWHLAAQDLRLLESVGPDDRCTEERGVGWWQRHTARVLAAADFLSAGWGLSRDLHDAACLAALFHDVAKYDGRDGEWDGSRNPDHARVAAEEMREAVMGWESAYGEPDPGAAAVLSLAAEAVACHMSVWSPSCPLAIAELPPAAAVLATCDIFASQAHLMWPGRD